MSYEPFLGEIKIFGFNYQTVGYRFCDGSLISINLYSALFAILGTTYGGDGINTFAIPDLRGRRAIGQGQSAGTSNYQTGQRSGNQNITLTTLNLPQHSHQIFTGQALVKIKASSDTANQTTASNNFNATPALPYYKNTATPGEYLGATEVSGTTEIAGGNQPVSILNPTVAMNFSIAMEGIFPTRD